MMGVIGIHIGAGALAIHRPTIHLVALLTSVRAPYRFFFALSLRSVSSTGDRRLHRFYREFLVRRGRGRRSPISCGRSSI